MHLWQADSVVRLPLLLRINHIRKGVDSRWKTE